MMVGTSILASISERMYFHRHSGRGRLTAAEAESRRSRLSALPGHIRTFTSPQLPARVLYRVIKDGLYSILAVLCSPTAMYITFIQLLRTKLYIFF